MIQRITSRQNERIKDCLKLRQSSYRNETKSFIVEGFHMVEMAAELGLVKAIFALKELNNIDGSIPQFIVDESIFEKISLEKQPQGILAIVQMKEQKAISCDKVLYLDEVSDPGNVGTLLRTALAFAYNDVVLSSKCASIYNEKVIQSSQGAIFKLNCLTNLSLESLKNSGYKILVTELRASKEISELKNIKKHVLVLGNEAHGVSEKSLDLADERIRIDINDIESLNVAIAGGICMHYFSKN